jgi:hypothetical protein
MSDKNVPPHKRSNPPNASVAATNKNKNNSSRNLSKFSDQLESLGITQAKPKNRGSSASTLSSSGTFSTLDSSNSGISNTSLGTLRYVPPFRRSNPPNASTLSSSRKLIASAKNKTRESSASTLSSSGTFSTLDSSNSGISNTSLGTLRYVPPFRRSNPPNASTLSSSRKLIAPVKNKTRESRASNLISSGTLVSSNSGISNNSLVKLKKYVPPPMRFSSFGRSNKNSFSALASKSSRGFNASVNNRTGASKNNELSSSVKLSHSFTFEHSFKNNSNDSKSGWFGFSKKNIDLMIYFQEFIFKSNGIFSIIDRIFSEVFKDDNLNSKQKKLLKFILYNQLNPNIPFRKADLEYYFRTFFEIFRDNLLIPILSMSDNVISRIIITITLGLLHEHVYILIENERKKIDDLAEWAPNPIKIASLFTEALYVFGLNIYDPSNPSFPINLPDCGDAISFLDKSDYIEVKLTEAKLSRYGLLERFLDPKLDTHLCTKKISRNNKNMNLKNERINKNEARISLPKQSHMVITKTTGVYLAKGFFLQPNKKKSDEFVLEFQNLSRDSEDIGAKIIERDQLRLVINTSKSKIKHIFEEVHRLFTSVPCPEDMKLMRPKFDFDNFFKKLEITPKRYDDETLKGASLKAKANI